MSSAAKALGYNGTIEGIYTIEHPEVVKWTNYFHKKIQERKIFENFHAKLCRNILTARIVSTGWHAFSGFMPAFLCRAASMMSTNLARHYVIQTAFEELGMRDHKQIHADLFWNAAKSIGITSEDSILEENGKLKKSLNFLKNQLMSYSCDMQVFGILLGLEMPAIENIETIYSAMSYNNFAKSILDKDLFFILHREVEIEHVRLTVANFLRFQKTRQDIDNFIEGFTDGVNFWDKFWCAIKEHTLRVTV